MENFAFAPHRAEAPTTVLSKSVGRFGIRTSPDATVDYICHRDRVKYRGALE